jgi:DNA-binding LytR/AlgR family response regulator
MRIAICEDNKNMQKRLEEAVLDWADARKVKTEILCYPSAEAFLMAWPEMPFDLAFLDIQMKHMTGIQLAECIRKTDSNMLIVFVTSFEQYSLKGYDVNALHYLIKPVSQTKLIPILDKARVIWKSRYESFLLIPTGEGTMKLPFADILYISISAHTAGIHTGENVYYIRKTINALAELLPSYFIRNHRSYIVNLFSVDCVFNDSLLLKNEETLPVSRKNMKETKDAFLRLHIGREI